MSRPPRLCFVIHHHPDTKIGGVELETQRIARGLTATHGWECHYVSRSHGGRWPTQPQADGVYLHGVPLGGRDRAYARYGALARVLDAVDADIYYQRIALSHTAMVAWYARRRRKPFVWATAHSEDCQPGKFTAFQNSVLPKRQTKGARRLLAQASAWLNDHAYVWGARQADLIITQTQDQQALLRRALGLESIVIHNINDVPQDPPPRRQPPLVLWIANLARFKQAERFIELARRCQDLDCAFVMAGHPLEAAYHDELLPQIAAVPRLTYLGGITPAAAERLMGEATLFVNTSRAEGVPNTFIESWLRGTPVLSLHVDPNDWLTAAGAGILAGSMARLEDAVRQLLSDHDAWTGYSQRARALAKREFDIQNITAQYHHAFTSLLANDRPEAA